MIRGGEFVAWKRSMTWVCRTVSDSPPLRDWRDDAVARSLKFGVRKRLDPSWVLAEIPADEGAFTGELWGAPMDRGPGPGEMLVFP